MLAFGHRLKIEVVGIGISAHCKRLERCVRMCGYAQQVGSDIPVKGCLGLYSHSGAGVIGQVERDSSAKDHEARGHNN